MSHSITIPAGPGTDPIVVRINNGTEVKYKRGGTYTVSDAVYAVLQQYLGEVPQRFDGAGVITVRVIGTESSITAQQIADAAASGTSVLCLYEDVVAPLVKINDNGSVVFHGGGKKLTIAGTAATIESDPDVSDAIAAAMEAAEDAGDAADDAADAASDASEAATAATQAAEAAAAAIEEISETLAGKANTTGIYPGLIAGSAKTIEGANQTERVFMHGSAGGSASIGNGAAVIKTVRGNTVYFRQKLKLRSNSGTTESGVTITKNNDGSYTVFTASGGATADVSYQVGTYSVIGGNYNLIKGCPAGGGEENYSLGSDYGFGWVRTLTTSQDVGLVIHVASGCEITTPIKFYPQVFDLTEIFGEGKEPSVEEFNAMFPEKYYSYSQDAQILHFKGTAYKTFGFNAWNGTFAPVIKTFDGAGQNHGYELHGTYTAVKFGYSTDSESASSRITLTPETYTTEKGDVVTRIVTPDNGYVFIEGAAGDTCLNLIWSGNRSGSNYSYEPYAAYTVELPVSTYFEDGMKKARNAFDTLSATQAIKRIGVLNLASLSWNMSGGGTIFSSTYFENCADNKKIKLPASAGNVNMMTAYCPTVSSTSSVGISIAVSGDNAGRLRIKTSEAYASVDAFKATLTGQVLFYELANPQTSTFETPLNLAASVDDMGIESVESASASAPASLQIAYALNVKDILSRLSMDYISKESFDNFCEALGEALRITITPTYNSASGKYTYVIEDMEPI